MQRRSAGIAQTVPVLDYREIKIGTLFAIIRQGELLAGEPARRTDSQLVTTMRSQLCLSPFPICPFRPAFSASFRLPFSIHHFF